jgi:DNA-binding MarR family transcriptional regulator
MTRALVGLTLHSLEALGGEVTLPQFRLLLIASGPGRAPSSRIAADAVMKPSSVTRLADKLEAAGLLVRGADPRSRSIVTIEVTGGCCRSRGSRWPSARRAGRRRSACSG